MTPRIDVLSFTHDYEIAFRFWNGIELVNHPGWPKRFHPFLPNPPVLGDVDGDGWPDIYLCSLQGPNRLFRNLGSWQFSEMDIGPAACADQFSTGAAFEKSPGTSRFTRWPFSSTYGHSSS